MINTRELIDVKIYSHNLTGEKIYKLPVEIYFDLLQLDNLEGSFKYVDIQQGLTWQHLDSKIAKLLDKIYSDLKEFSPESYKTMFHFLVKYNETLQKVNN